MLAPAGTPPEIVDRLANASLAALKEPAFHEKLQTLGFETIGQGPDGLRQRVAHDVPMFRELITKAGIERV
jgi:tripartite-type tricarboxylate transporter receptor subunit TctC